MCSIPRTAGVLSALAIGLGMIAKERENPPQLLTGKIQWVYDYEEGQRLSEKTGKPLMVVFRCEL